MRDSSSMIAALLLAAQSHMRGGPSLLPKTAIRRAARTSDWAHDEERVAAAKAKRERRRQRPGGASS